MKIHSIANTSIFQLSSMARPEGVSRKLSLPVDSSLVLYSRFKHVHGTPTLEKGAGLPLSSLRAMDNLIDRLISLKGRNTYLASVEGMTAEDIGFAVERLQKELNSKVSGLNPPLTAGSPQNDIGLSLDFVA